MVMRLLEILVPDSLSDDFETTVKEFTVVSMSRLEVDHGRTLFRLLALTDQTEPILDALQKRFSTTEGFRASVLSVETSVPRTKEGDEPPPVRRPAEKKSRVARISREEIYSAAQESAAPSVLYVSLAILAAMVAAAGFLEDNGAMIIGAMVLAPLLGSNVALSLGTTLGDTKLARKALLTLGIGVILSVGVGAVIGFAVGVNPSAHEMALRTRVGFGDVIVALAAGVAGTLAFTTRISGILVGVMVAVALLPPLVAFGMLIGSGHFDTARGALYLVLVNLIGINLAGTITFLAQGVHPLHWWQEEKARRATAWALSAWTALLIILIVVIYLSGRT